MNILESLLGNPDAEKIFDKVGEIDAKEQKHEVLLSAVCRIAIDACAIRLSTITDNATLVAEAIKNGTEIANHLKEWSDECAKALTAEKEEVITAFYGKKDKVEPVDKAEPVAT